jgi:carotenoid cleavage dioxygenase
MVTTRQRGEHTVLDLPVSGTLPAALTGRYVRIGPDEDPRPGQHTFTGDGMVHGVALRHGRAQWYRSRWIRTDRVCRRTGEHPLPGPRHGLSDNANANVIQHAGRTLALGEAGVLPVELDDELMSVATIDFDGTLPNGFATHPECDPVTGELFTVAYYHELPYVQYLIVDVTGRIRRCEPIEVAGTPMMHSLSLTDRHVLLYDFPVVFDPLLAAAGSRYPYAWRRDRPARIGVLPREAPGSAIRWFDVDPCYVFHPLNAYEQGDRIVADVIRHERVFDVDRLRPGEAKPMLHRWTIDLTAGSTTEEQLDDLPEECPRVDERRKTMPYRYAYTVAMRPGGSCLAGGSVLVKHDLHQRSVRLRDFGVGRSAGEAVFVPRDPRSGEDAGWLLTYVHDARTDTTDLVVLNADDFTGTPQAVVHLPVAVPPGFHAAWLPTW